MKIIKEKDKQLYVRWTLWDSITLPFYRAGYRIESMWGNFRSRCQRFRRGYAWTDVWNMNQWFIDTVRPMLEHLLKHHSGYPGNMSPGQYDEELSEMIECLRLMDEENAKEYCRFQEDNISMGAIQKYEDVMEKSKKRFFYLFEKNFWSLWD